MKKYSLSYVQGSTGYGWEKEYDRLDEFEDFVNEMRHSYSASVIVFDNTLMKIIFWKDCATYDIHKDILSNLMRDMRTTTKRAKIAGGDS